MNLQKSVPIPLNTSQRLLTTFLEKNQHCAKFSASSTSSTMLNITKRVARAATSSKTLSDEATSISTIRNLLRSSPAQPAESFQKNAHTDSTYFKIRIVRFNLLDSVRMQPKLEYTALLWTDKAFRLFD